jgi:hypothetical protein
MIEKDMMVLQKHTNSEMEVQDPCGKTNPSLAISIKVEVSGAEEEEGPVPISFPKIKVEPELRCMSLYAQCKQ